MTGPFITLNAAVTWLAFGKQRTPSEELELRRVDQHKIVDLIDACGVEVREDSRFASFPHALPLWPLRALVERLDQHRDHWPPSAKTLRALAVRLEGKWLRYDDDYDRALGRIIEAAQGGRLDLLGQASRRAGAEFRVMPPASLLGDVTIDHLRTDLGPDVTARERPRPFAILKSGAGLQPIAYKVVVFLEQLRRLFQGTGAGPLVEGGSQLTAEEVTSPHVADVDFGSIPRQAEGAGPVRREDPKPEELCDWFRSNKSYLETLGEAAQADELRKAFVISKNARQLLRSIKRDNDDLRPERGRPKKAGPKSRS